MTAGINPLSKNFNKNNGYLSYAFLLPSIINIWPAHLMIFSLFISLVTLALLYWTHSSGEACPDVWLLQCICDDHWWNHTVSFIVFGSCTTAFMLLPPALKSSINVSVLVPPATTLTEASSSCDRWDVALGHEFFVFLLFLSFCFNPQNFAPQRRCFLSSFILKSWMLVEEGFSSISLTRKHSTSSTTAQSILDAQFSNYLMK